jgi:phosphatidylserine/phosphatidylglycerophosphate/cardiolipin synthase-like enzyme
MLIGAANGGPDLLQLNASALGQYVEIVAAIPYASLGIASDELLSAIKDSGMPAKIFYRIDWSVPFDTRIIESMVTSNFQFSGVLNYLHAKVFWWKGWGAYIGSNNLTDRACFQNYELGVFLTDEQLRQLNLVEGLSFFFDTLHQASIQPSQELLNLLKSQVEKLAVYHTLRRDLEFNFAKSLQKL